MENIWVLFFLFSVYSFIGWLTESIVCSIPEHKFINRGFLNGPFCPIYGAGGILVTVTLMPFQNHLILLYTASVFITTLVEYLTGAILEKLFHTKYWDYSHRRCNLHGRICLGNSLAFGVMCVVGVRCVYPALMSLLDYIPQNGLMTIDAVLAVYFLFDTAITVNAVYQLNGKLDELQQILNEIKQRASLNELRQRASLAKEETVESIRLAFSGLLDEDAKSRFTALFEQMDKLESTSKRIQRRLLDAFPTMTSIQNNESLQRLKRSITERAQRITRR